MRSQRPVVHRLTAPAKLTLRLRLRPEVRADGLHMIDAEMVTLDFGDDLSLIEQPPDTTIEVCFLGADGGPLPPGQAPAPEDDLVAKALRLVGRSASVTVTKRIPAGAGLGGGSADAAAILRWAGFTDRERAAFELGADLAFCLVGGRARVGGIGEIIEPLKFEAQDVTLLTPPLHCSTAEVYRAWDRLGPHEVPGDNDLEVAALMVQPALAGWRDSLADATGQQPQLAGSGSTWFVFGHHPGPGRVVARTVPASL